MQFRLFGEMTSIMPESRGSVFGGYGVVADKDGSR